MAFPRMYYPVLLCALVALPWQAHGEITLQLIKERNPGLDWNELQRGKVVSSSLAKGEVNDAALAVVVAVKLPAPKVAVLEQLKQSTPGVQNIPIDISSQATIERSFQAYQLDIDDNSDLSWFKDPRADGTYNVSSAELALLEKAAKQVDASKPLTQASIMPFTKAVRGMLIGRLDEYLQHGLKGIAPYDVDGEQIFPGDYLADSLAPLELMQQQLPEFYRAFLDFPAPPSDQFAQEFFVVKEREGDRPITSLKHWMVDQQANYTVIAERKFYISHSLDAMNTLILALEEGNESYLFMVNLSFTQQVTGIGSFIAHKVGRSKVKENIVPLFEELKQHFE